MIFTISQGDRPTLCFPQWDTMTRQADMTHQQQMPSIEELFCFCLYTMNKCWPKCRSRREKWGNESWWLTRAPRWQGHFYFYFYSFYVCFGTLSVAVGWCMKCKLKCKVLCAWVLGRLCSLSVLTSGRAGGVWSLRFLVEAPVDSVGIGVRMYQDRIFQCIRGS